MKTAAIQKLRQKLAADEPVFGLWVTLESASITEMAVGLGFDWVVIDAEHGSLDWGDINEHLRATVRSDTVALVRIAELNIGLIKRALDIGADGVVVPWIETPDQLRQAVQFAQYPLDGLRGIGAERATGWGRCFVEHVSTANEHVLVVPIIETTRAGQNIEQLCAVPGVEIMLIGPADYSSTAGYAGQWEGPGVADQLLAIKDTVRRHGKQCGLLATSDENLQQRQSQGFRFLGVGLDAGLLMRSLTGALQTVGRDRQLQASFIPGPILTNPVPATPAPLACPPAHIRPDRGESINLVSDAAKIELEPGVVFQPLVGGHNQARGLTTGVVTFSPGARLPYHTHPHPESVTVLSGEIVVEVEGRRYTLGPLDNIYLPSGVAHHVANHSGQDLTVLHIAMATSEPRRTLVEDEFVCAPMPDAATGVTGREQLHRHATTEWYEPNPGAKFQDFFNKDLGSEGMSGGYGLFAPGARLPCHLHDFDESITIVEGTATCVVEGRTYSVSDCGTALAPRGRCHYFINHTDRPMAMIWVYAGSVPQRIVLQESCCQRAETVPAESSKGSN